MEWAWHWWQMGGLFWIPILALIIALLIRGSTLGNPRQPPPRTQESPEDILKRRYASGELSEEDYHRMLNEIRR
jgi:putative membrane protein